MQKTTHQSQGSGTWQACPQCSAGFEITKDDLAFYEKVSPEFGGEKYQIPPPTLCPDCRAQRRFCWRNERHLYHRKCDLTGKTIISNFSPDKQYTVYEYAEWWSDTWDAKQYGRAFDFKRPFFEQYAELLREVPQLNLSVWNSENSNFCNYIGNVKNSYLLFGSVYSEDCCYGSPYYSKDCVDTLVVRECERCYACIDSRKLYECNYCQDCHSSSGLTYCYDLQACSDCIACVGLRNKKFCIFNEEHTEQDYKKKKAELDLCVPHVHEILREKLQVLRLQVPHRYMQSNQAEDVSGNYIYQSKNVHDSYYADRSHDSRFCGQVVDLKDCYDNNFTEENELCCDYLGAYQNHRVSFSLFCNRVSDALYCNACHSSRYLFGCSSIRSSEYCILNKQYTKEQYEALVPKIIEHMRTTGEWGQFLPANISPFGYNETVAQEFFPLTADVVTAKGWTWFEEQKAQDNYFGPDPDVPPSIDDVSDDITKKILLCSVTGTPYKIIPQELKLYRSMHLPIPRKCPNQRHLERVAMRNPRSLWSRECAKCSKQIQTTYSPDRPEKIYCEECYLSTVY